jgi:hypothetical protein
VIIISDNSIHLEQTVAAIASMMLIVFLFDFFVQMTLLQMSALLFLDFLVEIDLFLSGCVALCGYHEGINEGSAFDSMNCSSK